MLSRRAEAGRSAGNLTGLDCRPALKATMPRYDEGDVAAEFRDALRAQGYHVASLPIMDGRWHRVAVDGDKGKRTSGRYRGYLDGMRPAGFMQNFRDSTKTGSWKTGTARLPVSDAERVSAHQRMAAARAARERQAEARQAVIAQRSLSDWDASRPAPDSHPYLLRKRLSDSGLRVDRGGWLLVPMRDFAGHIRCLQTIAPDGRKLFPAGSSLHGLHLLLGEVRPNHVLLITEGWATAKTLHQATGNPVVVAFANTNFATVALGYCRQVPGLRFAFCGDNDHAHPHRLEPLPNVGKEAAEAAAHEVGGAVVLPDFKAHEQGYSDWNDYAVLHGFEAVRTAIAEKLIAAGYTQAPAKDRYDSTRSPEDVLADLKREITTFIVQARRHVEIKREWVSMKDEIEILYKTHSPERRAALRKARREMDVRYGKDWREPGVRLLLPGPAGSGKTTLAAEKVAEHKGKLGNLSFYTDKIANAEAVSAQIPGSAVVRGRSAPDPKNSEKTMCWRPEAAEAVARAGLPVGAMLCDDGAGKVCPFKKQCGYQRELARFRSGEITEFVGSQLYLPLSGPMPTPDVVVIDENCIGALVGCLELDIDHLLEVSMPSWPAAGLELAIAYRKTMVKVREAVRDPEGILAGLRQRGISNATHLNAAIKYARKVEEREFTNEITPDLDDGRVLEVIERYQRSQIGSVLKMLVALGREIGLPRKHAHGVVFWPDKEVQIDGRIERRDCIVVHYLKRPAFRSDVPALILDASGDVEIYRRLFGNRLRAAAELRCQRNVEVVQVRDITMARTSLTGTGLKGSQRSETSPAKAARLRAEVVEVVKALAAKHGLFMLATNKSVEELLAPYLGGEVTTGHFGALRGRNDFQDCVAGMVLGREQPPAGAMEDIARALWADDPEPLFSPGGYVEARRDIQMRDGSTVSVQVQVHPDARVQRVVELHRERESEQAVDRLRLILNPVRKTVYLACDLPLDLVVDRVVTWRELVHELTGRLDNGRQGTGRRFYGNRLAEAWYRSGGILPLSRGELVRVFPDLWGSERAVRDDLGEDPSCWRTRLIEFLLAESANNSFVTVRYRRSDTGRPIRALVGLPGDAGRAVLEALVGPVMFYEVEGQGDPNPPPAGLTPKPHSVAERKGIDLTGRH